MTIQHKEYEDGYYGALSGGSAPSFGRIESVVGNGLVSGSLLETPRAFTDAFFLMYGGQDWGTSCMPQVGDIVLVIFTVKQIAFAIPFSGSFGSVVGLGNTGFQNMAPGEIHQHSKYHAECLMDAAGNWSAYDSVGDSIQLDASNGVLRIKAWNQTYQYYGFDASGEPQVTVTAGLVDMGNGPYRVSDDGKSLVPNAPTYHIRSKGDIVIEAPNGAVVRVKDNGISIEGGTNPDTGKPNKVSIGGRHPVLYSKIDNADMPITGLNQIGVSDFVTVGGTDTVMLDGIMRNDFMADPEDPPVV